MEILRPKVIPGLLVILLFGVIGTVAVDTPALASQPTGFDGGVTTTIGQMLFDEFLAAFEMIDVLLVAALVGGLYLAKRDDEKKRESVEKAVEMKPRFEAPEAEESMGDVSSETGAKEVETDGSG
ncbi:MAG: hypothetical protein SV760_08560 [Halobacteria archaeon]|nr:hypothetical protein [Halobacteria archaeon]